MLSPQGTKGWAEIASFGGTNFFQGLAEGQVDGLMARALAIKVLDPRGEEMPYFREMWIEKPSVVADLLVVHAVLDSDSVTGAFRFTIRPGEATIMDTECTLFPRRDLDNYGLASMSATHLLGFIDHGKFNDYRPNVDEVGGVQMLTGAGEWVWRPVSNRDELQISTFQDTKPRGFGCLVRDRDFQNYLDEANHWERRPSLWIEPLGDWGEGGVQLIEIPSQSDANDNILCFWRPKAPLKAGQETSFAYRQFWCWDPPERPDVALTARSHSGAAGRHRRYFVEFEGDVLADPERTKGMTPTLTASAGSITFMRTFAVPERKAFRVLFELDPKGRHPRSCGWCSRPAASGSAKPGSTVGRRHDRATSARLPASPDAPCRSPARGRPCPTRRRWPCPSRGCAASTRPTARSAAAREVAPGWRAC